MRYATLSGGKMFTRTMLLNGEQPTIYADTIVNGVFAMFYNQRKSGKNCGRVLVSIPIQNDIAYLIDFFKRMEFFIENQYRDDTEKHFTVAWWN